MKDGDAGDAKPLHDAVAAGAQQQDGEPGDEHGPHGDGRDAQCLAGDRPQDRAGGRGAADDAATLEHLGEVHADPEPVDPAHPADPGAARTSPSPTTGLTALQALSDAETIHVECLGGTLRPLSQGFVGPLTEAALERMTFDQVFLGTDGISPEHGISEADLRRTRPKELMARRADHVYVLAHAAKLGRRPFHAWTALRECWTLVTDDCADPCVVDELRTRGVATVLTEAAPPEGGIAQ